MAQTFFCNDRETTVKTEKGMLKGYKLGNVYAFKGIPYATAKRFRAPEEVEAWDGVKEALNYGYTCPLLTEDSFLGDLLSPHRFWPQGEDCLNLNIWTKSIEKGVKKPVAVWFHGGGFFAGSSVEQLAYDGTALAEKEDIVLVSVNHRLNLLGFMDLRSFGEERKDSCNAGVLDMIAALKWVHENIEAFGGDSKNVTIFGQSGGGGKVITLMQSPQAEGLFQKAMIMSGVLGNMFKDYVDGRMVVLKTLELLGLKEQEVDKLDTIPYKELAEAYVKAYYEVSPGPGFPYFAPQKSDVYLGDPMKNGFCEFAKTIPVVIGSTFSEFNGRTLGLEKKSDEEVREYLVGKFGEDGNKAADLFQTTYPDLPLHYIVNVDVDGFRCLDKEWIRRRTEEGCAPTYTYMFNLCHSINDGQMAWHCADIPFFFHNVEVSPVSNMGEVSEKLEKQMSGAFANFVRTGKPYEDTLSEWPACEVGKENTMIFDKVSRVRVNHDDEMMETFRPMHIAPGLFG